MGGDTVFIYIYSLFHIIFPYRLLQSWRSKWKPILVFLTGKSEQRSLVGYSAWGCKRVGCDLATKQQQQANYRVLSRVPCALHQVPVDYQFYKQQCVYGTFQVALVVKNLPVNARDIRDMILIPGSRRFPGGGHGDPLKYSCLENLTDRGAQWAMVHRVAKNQTRLKRLGSSSDVYMLIPTLYMIPPHTFPHNV